MLSIDDLNFGFIVWLIACGVSIIGFVAEILVKILNVNGNILLRKVIGILLFVRLLRWRVRHI